MLSILTPPLLLLLLFTPHSVANTRIIESKSLAPCMSQSSFAASFFHVRFTPDNGSLHSRIDGDSQVSDHVVFDLRVSGYGYEVFHMVLNPCSEEGLKGLCPMRTGRIDNMELELPPLSKKDMDRIPNAIYHIPDLDGLARIWINSTKDGKPLACVDADIRNGKTVHQPALAWALAGITLLCLLTAATASGCGHATTSAHIAANAMSMLGFFQAQALIGMTSVTTPPIVQAWSQNFQWTMGIARTATLQRFATWYLRATGGTPSTLLSSLDTTSVRVQRRSNDRATNAHNIQIKSVRGIARVSFLANIEITNTFFTAFTVFLVVMAVASVVVACTFFLCQFLVGKGLVRGDRFAQFRRGWKGVLKGVYFRVVMIGFLPMTVLSFWQFTRRDSSAEAILAVSLMLCMLYLLCNAAWTIHTIYQRSISLHKSPAYMLYSDEKMLNTWGFLYVQYKASHAYFIIPTLALVFIKGIFVGTAQNAPIVIAVALLVVELIFLVMIAVARPYMNRRTNILNISILSMNFFNALLLLFFTGAFDIPPLGIGVLGVLYFILNTLFTALVLTQALIPTFRAIFTHHPDEHYDLIKDDRTSFIRSVPNVPTPSELVALAETARGESRMGIVGASGSRVGSPAPAGVKRKGLIPGMSDIGGPGGPYSRIRSG